MTVSLRYSRSSRTFASLAAYALGFTFLSPLLGSEAFAQAAPKRKPAPRAAPKATPAPVPATAPTPENTEPTAEAEAGAPAQVPPPAPAAKSAPVAGSKKGASAAARAKKRVSLNAMSGFIPRIAYGSMVGIHIESHSIVELFGETGTYSWDISSDRTRAGVRYLFFPGNSFFVSGGIAYDVMTGKDTGFVPAITTGLGNNSSWEGEYHQIEGEFGIGNRWMWDFGLNIGATWIGYSQGAMLSEKYSSTGATPEEEKAQNDNFRNKAKDGSLHFAKFTLGFAF